MGGFSPRHARAFHNLGLVTGGSRLARRPQRLPEPDIRPEPGCVPPAPLTIHDNFDRGSYTGPPALGGSTSTSGHTWTQYRGTHRVRLGGVSPYNGTSTAYNATGNRSVAGFDYGSTNFHLAIRFAAGAGTSNRGLWLAGTSNSGYVVGDGSIDRFTSFSAGTSTSIGSHGNPGNGTVVEVVKIGGLIEVYHDGVQTASVTDGSPLTGTLGGIYTRFADSNPADAFYDYGYLFDPCEGVSPNAVLP